MTDAMPELGAVVGARIACGLRSSGASAVARHTSAGDRLSVTRCIEAATLDARRCSDMILLYARPLFRPVLVLPFLFSIFPDLGCALVTDSMRHSTASSAVWNRSPGTRRRLGGALMTKVKGLVCVSLLLAGVMALMAGSCLTLHATATTPTRIGTPATA